MKKIVYFLAIILTTTSCGNSSKKEQKTEMIGGEKDQHGCLVSAGESWSELKQICLQIFNEGIRLNPIETKETEAIFSAFVLFNDEKNKVELFFPDQPNLILNQVESAVYQADKYQFNAETGILSFEGKDIFKVEK